mmetsp:Transcript_125378/g.360196  ORF Transcript_125378/g.360196 Transcript_125378/m.360196 type:complete len:205 (-) Transcript_125378:328-942(-)
MNLTKWPAARQPYERSADGSSSPTPESLNQHRLASWEIRANRCRSSAVRPPETSASGDAPGALANVGMPCTSPISANVSKRRAPSKRFKAGNRGETLGSWVKACSLSSSAMHLPSSLSARRRADRPWLARSHSRYSTAVSHQPWKSRASCGAVPSKKSGTAPARAARPASPSASVNDPVKTGASGTKPSKNAQALCMARCTSDE